MRGTVQVMVGFHVVVLFPVPDEWVAISVDAPRLLEVWGVTVPLLVVGVPGL
ncbi:hypothetical protein [Streptomyces sp. NPDC001816]|uniref:hypothetical protein n=1 Tax=Streptomyces sp. NPDC001816 TaxID=3364612 RepID=UPI0036B5D7E5